ncbi:phage tail tape measure protein [Clostridium beijerinckii]|uniref:phage tail tape measure protein n=1 Tax=Clostridium beijerinckii TaxID=1520 RepID=UPI001570A788|nr:phage tail tape measure protein [Clostridium beijerinckii]NRU52578.1 uncharacterized protein (DUF2147 family) [Clostridium beijerinckii]NYC69245.1 uncharacterized protein (DUF2147 family) [Clostridium beijerinckii]NYC91779.1 uncharacterized protein (DUF2147 family) [Clostridium beijerinckii]
MAEYKNNIKIGIAFDKQKDIQGQLDSLIKSLNNTKINLDINLNNTDLVKKLENITKMADNFKSSFGGNISLGNVDQVINKTISAMGSLNGELLKTNIKTFNDIVTKSISTNIGEVTRQTEKFINESGQLQKIGETITTVTENSERFKQSMNDIQKAMLSLESMKLNGLVDTNSIEKLKTDLNTVFSESNKENGIKFSDNELKNYLNQVKALENEEKNLKEIQDINNRELEAMYKLQQDDLKQLQQLEQQREKELLQEQMLIERQAEAYKQIDVMKANGIISNSDIAKLESMVQKANSLKDMNKALSEIMTTSMMKESSIVTLSKQLDEAQVKLDKMKSTFGNKLPDGFIQSTESQINKLKEDLTKVDGMNFNGIKNSLNDINTGMKVTNNETKELVNSLKETNNNSFFGSMSSFLGKIGVFYGIQQVTQEISQQLKNAASYTIDMDKSMTNMQMITGKSKSDVGDIVNNYKQLGEQLHTTNSEMMRGMEEVTRAGFDGKEGESLMSASIMGSKLSGQTTEQVTQQLIAIKNAFNMTGEQMQNVVDMMSKMDNVSATSLDFDDLVV